MGLISKFIELLFKKKTVSSASNINHLMGWEKKRAERIKVAEEKLKPWITATAKEKKSLPFGWESGNDEAFVTFKDATEAEADNFEELEMYIIDKLDIPDAGEFQMTGSGEIYVDNNVVKVKYSSTMKEIIDFDEETEQEIYGEGEEDSADLVLFAI